MPLYRVFVAVLRVMAAWGWVEELGNLCVVWEPVQKNVCSKTLQASYVPTSVEEPTLAEVDMYSKPCGTQVVVAKMFPYHTSV
jgi:hypothetical protein